MPSSGGQRSRELFSPAANRAEQAQTLATQETKWKESQRRHSTQAANVRMEPGKPDSGPIGLNAIALALQRPLSGHEIRPTSTQYCPRHASHHGLRPRLI